jgi:hypothetical protein
MHILFKNLIASGMLLLVISHGILQFGMFELFQSKHRAEVYNLISKGVPDEDRVIFSFSISEYGNYITSIEWKDENEFRYKDKMFDIIKTEVKGDSVYLYCLYDSNDTDLFAVLDKLIEEDSENSDEQIGLDNYLSQNYSCSSLHFYNYPLLSDNNYSEKYIYNLLDGEYLLNTPPPRA